MKVFPLLGAFFLAIPLIEIALFVVVGGEIGLAWTILIVFLTGIIGAGVVAWQGLAVMETAQRDLAENRLPVRSVVEGILLLVAAAMLITPGFATDTIGFALTIPPLRAGAAEWIRARVLSTAIGGEHPGDRRGNSGPHGGAGPGPVIEGEIIDSDRRRPGG